jgi:phosphorylcholine metabolism protein LicD
MGGIARFDIKENLDLALKLLKVTANALESSDVNYCLDAGTLLGVMREQRLLPWDTDVDLSIMAQELPKLHSAIWKLRLQGYRVRPRKFKRDMYPFKRGAVRIFKIRRFRSLFIKSQLTLDIFVCYPDGDNMSWAEGIRKKATKKSMPTRLHKYTKTEFNGRKYPIPKHYDEYLTVRYGDWRTPVKNWNNFIDDPAQVGRDSPEKPA